MLQNFVLRCTLDLVQCIGDGVDCDLSQVGCVQAFVKQDGKEDGHMPVAEGQGTQEGVISPSAEGQGAPTAPTASTTTLSGSSLMVCIKLLLPYLHVHNGLAHALQVWWD